MASECYINPYFYLHLELNQFWDRPSWPGGKGLKPYMNGRSLGFGLGLSPTGIAEARVIYVNASHWCFYFLTTGVGIVLTTFGNNGGVKGFEIGDNRRGERV